MTIEQDVGNALQEVVPRVYADFADFNTQKPFVTFQRIGGKSYSYVDDAAPNLRQCLVQVNVWATTRGEADALALLIETAMRSSPLFSARPESESTAVFDDDSTDARGTRQDFTVWSTR